MYARYAAALPEQEVLSVLPRRKLEGRDAHYTTLHDESLIFLAVMRLKPLGTSVYPQARHPTIGPADCSLSLLVLTREGE